MSKTSGEIRATERRDFWRVDVFQCPVQFCQSSGYQAKELDPWEENGETFAVYRSLSPKKWLQAARSKLSTSTGQGYSKGMTTTWISLGAPVRSITYPTMSMYRESKWRPRDWYIAAGRQYAAYIQAFIR